MMARRALVVVVTLVQIGCMMEGPLYDQALPSSKIEMASYDIIVNDKRSAVEIREFSIPAMLGQGGPDFVSPPLDSAIEDRARQVIERSRVAGSRKLAFTVDVFIGCQRFTEDLLFKEEFVKWKLEVQVSEKDSHAPALTAIGESWGRRTSRDAPPERLREMYLDSFAQALQDALSRLDKSRGGG